VYDAAAPRRGGLPVTRTTAAHIDAATRLLAQEGGCAGTAGERAAAAGRIYEKLFARLAPLIGDTGVRALFVRSVKLARADVPFLDEIAAAPQSRAQPPPEHELVRCLGRLPPDAASEAAARVYATLIALMTTFIGERLVLRVIESAFPATDDTMPKETE
jgi:hypothetical protein